MVNFIASCLQNPSINKRAQVILELLYRSNRFIMREVNFMDDLLQLVEKTIKESSNIVAFTGAGVSTESGIPDFRSDGGLYNDKGKKYLYPPETILSHTFFMEHTELFYEYYRDKMIYLDVKPNDCHKALAVLEGMGKLKAVVTQNIDGLHQAAGSRNVLELHGSIHRNSCMKCGKAFGLVSIVESKEIVPRCEKCQGIIKPDVVLYEEMLDQEVISTAVNYIREADVLLIIGTSLVVYPAAGLIDYYRGSKLVLINKSVTPYDSRAQLVVHDSAGSVLKSIMESMK